MTAVFCLSGVAAVVLGCWWERRYERRFETSAARDLAPVPMDALDRQVALILNDDIFAELDELWLADQRIDYTRTAGGLR